MMATGSNRGQQQLLLVDDMESNILMLNEALSEEYRTFFAMDGPSALEMVAARRPDLILLDIQMPGMDGLEVCRRLKADPRHARIPVIFITSLAEHAAESAGLDLGAVDYISKPFNPAIVRSRVKNHLALKQYQDHLEELVRERTAELETARDRAESANRAKSDFLANMSHEIRTPMNSIIGMTELVLESEGEAENKKYLSTVLSSAKSLLYLINNVLDLSKIESRKLELESIVFDLRQALEGVIEPMQVLAQAKNIALSGEVEERLPNCFKGDPIRLCQVVMNLVGNAIKFTEKGQVRLTVAQEGEGRLHFAVTDTGIGIPADRQPYIFDSFTQADSSTTRKFGGTGLGTTIAKGIVDKMGGRIWVESSEGQGSVFHFVIPLPEAKGVTACRDRRKQHRDILASTAMRVPLHILIADDVEANRTLVITRLKQRGHRVTVAEDGLQVLECYAREPFDVILMDLQMPNMDGMEATRIIRGREAGPEGGRRTPIIALTAHSMASDRRQCLEAGMDDYISKPIDFDHLYQALARLFPTDGSGGAALASVDPLQADPAAQWAFPELPGIDVAAALAQWKDAQVYRKSLLAFVQRHTEDAGSMRAALLGGERQEAERLAHALKGAAASLCAHELAAAAAALEAGLHQGEGEVGDRLAALEGALSAMAAACRQLETEPVPAPDVELAPVGAIDSRQLTLLRQIAQALDGGDFVTAEQHLPELAEGLRGTLLEPAVQRLMTQVEGIQCGVAQTTLTEILRTLGVDPHGDDGEEG
ncbi:MAG: response regulator [Magnetococcus sp. YQC-3]